MSVFTDNFNRSSLGSNWSSWWGRSNLVITSNTLNSGITDGSNSTASYYNGQTFAADSYVKLKLASANTDFSIAAMSVRIGGTLSSPNCYTADIWPNYSQVRIIRYDASAETVLCYDGGITITAGDIYEFRAVGPNLTLYQNGVPILSHQDSTYTSGGYSGLVIYKTSAASSYWDDFECGDFTLRTVADTFTYADGTIPSHFTKFNSSAALPTVVSNQVKTSTNGEEQAAYYNNNTFTAAQFAGWTFRSSSATYAYSGACVRLQGSLPNSQNGYFADVITFNSGGTWTARIIRWDSGVEATALATTTITPSANDVFLLTAVGSTLTLYRNGSSILTASDGTYSSAGYAGFRVYSYNGSAPLYMDNFVAGDLVGTTELAGTVSGASSSTAGVTVSKGIASSSSAEATSAVALTVLNGMSTNVAITSVATVALNKETGLTDLPLVAKSVYRFLWNHQSRVDEFMRGTPRGSQLIAIYNIDQSLYDDYTTIDTVITSNLSAINASGRGVMGFVYSGGTIQAQSVIKGHIDTWYANAPGISGIYIGAAYVGGTIPGGQTFAQYWSDIADYIHGKGGIAWINADVTQIAEADQPGFMQKFQAINVYESYVTYTSGVLQMPTIPNWVKASKYSREKFLVFCNGVSGADLSSLVTYLLNNNIGWIYITNVDGGAVEDTTYWDNEQTYLQANSSNAVGATSSTTTALTASADKSVASSISVVTTSSAALTDATPLTAAGIGAAAGAAAVSISVPLAIAVTDSAAGAGAIAIAKPLAATASVSAALTGGATVAYIAGSSATDQATVTAALTRTAPIAANAVVTASGTASESQSIPLAGTGAGSSTATPSLTDAYTLASAALASVTVIGYISDAIPVSTGASVVSSIGSAAVTIVIPLAGATIASSSTTPSVTLSKPIAVSQSGASSVTADAVVSYSAAVTAIATASTAAGLFRTAPVASASGDTVSSSAALSQSIPIAASVGAIASATAAESDYTWLAASSAAASTSTAALSHTAWVASSASSIASATGLSQVNFVVAAAANGVATATASISESVPLAGTGVSAALTSGNVSELVSLSVSCSVALGATAGVSLSTPCATSASASPIVVANLFKSVPIASDAAATTTVTSAPVVDYIIASTAVSSAGSNAQTKVDFVLAAIGSVSVTATGGASDAIGIAANNSAVATASVAAVVAYQTLSSVSAVSSASGGINSVIPIATNAACSVSATGNLTDAIPLAGNTSGGTYGTSSASVAWRLDTIVSALAASNGAITDLIPLAVSASGLSTVSANETVSFVLAGTAAATVSTSALLYLNEPFDALAFSLSTTSASANLVKALACAASAVVSGNTTASLQVVLAASATAVVGVVSVANSAVSKPIAASVSSSTSGSATPETILPLGSIVSSTASSNCAITAISGCSGTLSCITTATADLLRGAPVAGSISAYGGTSAALHIDALIYANGAVISSGAVLLGLSRNLAGAGVGQASIDGITSVAYVVQGIVSATNETTGSIANWASLAGNAGANSLGSASESSSVPLAASAGTVTTAYPSLAVNKLLDGAASGSILISAETAVAKSLAANASIEVSVQADTGDETPFNGQGRAVADAMATLLIAHDLDGSSTDTEAATTGTLAIQCEMVGTLVSDSVANSYADNVIPLYGISIADVVPRYADIIITKELGGQITIEVQGGGSVTRLLDKEDFLMTVEIDGLFAESTPEEFKMELEASYLFANCE